MDTSKNLRMNNLDTTAAILLLENHLNNDSTLSENGIEELKSFLNSEQIFSITVFDIRKEDAASILKKITEKKTELTNRNEFENAARLRNLELTIENAQQILFSLQERKGVPKIVLEKGAFLLISLEKLTDKNIKLISDLGLELKLYSTILKAFYML